MSKFIGSAIVGIALCASLPVIAQAKEEPAAEAAAAVLAAPVEPIAAPAAKPLTAEEQIRAQLEGTQWNVQLNPSSGAKGLSQQKDTITFTKKQVKSAFLEKAGYPATNYSLTIGGDGRAVWETMQTKEGEGVAFWRGEIDGAAMHGVLSKHPTDGESEDYSIKGQSAGEKQIVIPGAEAAATSAVKVQAPPVTTAAPKAEAKQPEKKKKRGWF